MLPKQHRLRLEQDIKTLFAKGKGVFDTVCGIKYRRNDLPASRFAVVVGVKVSKNAVVRNRIRRKIREVVRLRLPMVVPGHDVMFLVRSEALKKTPADLERHVVAVLKKAGLLKSV